MKKKKKLDQEGGTLTIRNISSSDSEVFLTIRLHVSEIKIKLDVYGILQLLPNSK